MSLYEEFHKILTALKLAWLWRGMLRQQNDEMPPSSEEATQSSAAQQPAGQGNIQPSPVSGQQNDAKPSPTYSNSPTISRNENSRFSVVQVASTNNSFINPSFTASGPNIKQNEATQSSAAQQPAGQRNIQPSPVSRQQNDEKPSPSYSNTPTISENTDSEFSVVQAASVNDSTINPSFTGSGPNNSTQRIVVDLRSLEALIKANKKPNG